MSGSADVPAGAIAAELMALPPDTADMRANVFMRRWGFPNTYTLGKHLTEHLVAKYQVRADLISSHLISYCLCIRCLPHFAS